MPRILGLLLTFVLLVPPVLGDDKPAPDLPRAELDARIDKLLRDVINTGSKIHNAGDPAGCYRFFQGSLATLGPLLDHRPPLQEAIAKGLKAAELQPDAADRAFALREVIDGLRAALKKKDAKPMPPAEPKKPAGTGAPDTITLLPHPAQSSNSP